MVIGKESADENRCIMAHMCTLQIWGKPNQQRYHLLIKQRWPSHLWTENGSSSAITASWPQWDQGEASQEPLLRGLRCGLPHQATDNRASAMSIPGRARDIADCRVLASWYGTGIATLQRKYRLMMVFYGLQWGLAMNHRSRTGYAILLRKHCVEICWNQMGSAWGPAFVQGIQDFRLVTLQTMCNMK